MKLNQVKVQVLEAASADALTDDIATWVADPVNREATFLSLEYGVAAGVFSVAIVYAT